MTPEEQNIAIAKACGWTALEDAQEGLLLPQGLHKWKGYPPKNPVVGQKELIPSYTTDLNAMHEAEKALTEEQYLEYRSTLVDQLGVYGAIRSTAFERAETFLKTLGLWKD